MNQHDTNAPDEFEGYDQQSCPKCGHQEMHMPINYTETMLAQCNECRYEFIKRPKHLETLEIDATPNDELRALIDEWQKAQYGDKRQDRYSVGEVSGLSTAGVELEGLLDDTQDNE